MAVHIHSVPQVHELHQVALSWKEGGRGNKCIKTKLYEIKSLNSSKFEIGSNFIFQVHELHQVALGWKGEKR